jgi:hypothetical protein
MLPSFTPTSTIGLGYFGDGGGAKNFREGAAVWLTAMEW